MKAIWNNQIIAESNQTVVVESNHYFPESSLRKEFFIPSNTRTHCPWKGEAHYFVINVGDNENIDAAWYYPSPKEAASSIAGRVAFWKGVEVVE